MQVPLRATKISFFQPRVSCTPDSTTNKAFSRHSVSKAEQKKNIAVAPKQQQGRNKGDFGMRCTDTTPVFVHSFATTWSRLQRNAMSLPICICHH